MSQGTELTIEDLLESTLNLIQENREKNYDYRKVMALRNLIDACGTLCEQLAISRCSTHNFTMDIKETK